MSSKRTQPGVIDSTIPDQANKKRIFLNAEELDVPAFRLNKDFVNNYKTKHAPFGYNGLGEVVYRRTYARLIDDNGTQEDWYMTVERVVNGTYNMQKRWIETHELGWNPDKAQRSAQEMYDRIFNMKFLPPGRGLWAMGTELTETRGLFAALNNCAFVSTAEIRGEPFSKPFCFLMDATLLGIGVGFDTLGAQRQQVIQSIINKPKLVYCVHDSREGWVESLRLHLDCYFEGTSPYDFDYSKIRAKGARIKDLGGTAAGPDALRQLHVAIDSILEPLVGRRITVVAIADIMNLIGRCVQGGGTRRSAEIAFGDPTDQEYIDLKNYSKNPQREAWGWASNNSVYATVGMDYTKLCERIKDNGEPGLAWLENMKVFGRMDGQDNGSKDARAQGGNPCMEQTLESYEVCNLVETFPCNHTSFADFRRTLKYAYLYAKTVTLGRTHWPTTNRVMLRNRRIGTSMSGIAQFLTMNGIETLRQWCTEGYRAIEYYDHVYSDWLAIPRSIKITSIKPSGTVSLLAGATPGMHYPESRFFIRRIRMHNESDLIAPLRDAGYGVEKDVYDANLSVVSFPVDIGAGIRSNKDLSMWEQLGLASFLQRYWADNQVSCTITFDPANESKDIAHAVDLYQYQLKGISFLPRLEQGSYQQMPQEAITEEVYKKMVAQLKIVDFANHNAAENEMTLEKFCDSTKCML